MDASRAPVRPARLERLAGVQAGEVSYGSAEADYSTDVLREKAKQFITESVAMGAPFFLHLSFKAPHGPFIPAPRHDGMFAGLPPWRRATRPNG